MPGLCLRKKSVPRNAWEQGVFTWERSILFRAGKSFELAKTDDQQDWKLARFRATMVSLRRHAAHF
jgi:hypothetical protein